MNKALLLLISLASFLLAKPIVSVSIPPQAYFLERISGDTLQIHVVLPSNANEHHFDLKPNDMVMLEKSDLYFTVGLEFEKILNTKFKSNFKNLLFIDTQKYLTETSFIQDDHEHNHEHDHANLDPHVWLDPLLVKIQARGMAEVLMQRYPEHKILYEKNLSLFEAELQSLHERIKAQLSHIKNRSFVIYHPSWGYFAKRYDLIQIAVEVDGKEPKIKDIQALIKQIKNDKITVIFMQPGSSPRSVKMLTDELPLKIVYLNHLARNWTDELLKIPIELSQLL